jgi:hypothetical protein
VQGAALNTIEEMITIAHHLYVLRRNGIIGHLIEFGCGKGFSTAFLSNACFELGLCMDVFNPSSSGYKAGESPSDIERNLTEFGQIGCVKSHKGPFAHTLPKFTASPSCIWIGRDFGSSTSDVMTLLERLPARSCVFSRGCSEEQFATAAIYPDAVSAIIDAFQRTGRNITGRYLFSGTGAFWDKNVSWPVLPTDAVLRLVRLG